MSQRDPEEQNLRIIKLQLEVDDMKKSPFKKVPTWTGVAAILLALAGVVLQGVTNDIAATKAALDNTRQELAIAELQRKKTDATKELDTVTKQLQGKKEELTDLLAQMNSQQVKFDAASNKLVKLTARVDRLSSSAPKSQQQTDNEIRAIALEIRETNKDLLTEVQTPPITKAENVTKPRENNKDTTPKIYPGDPQKGKWGMSAERNGRKIVADYRKLHGGFYSVTIRVVTTGGLTPLKGKVIFHLHNTFPNQNPIINVENGEAVLRLKSYGAFTVGAEADDGKTMLELDMDEDPNAPPSFKGQ